MREAGSSIMLALFDELRPQFTAWEGDMKQLPYILLILAVVGLAIGLVLRLIHATPPTGAAAYLVPIFYWHGAMAFLAVAITVLLIQIRDK